MSLEIALTKLAEAIEAQTNVIAGLMASSAAATIPANTKPAAADDADADAEAAKKAKEDADKKAKEDADKKAKEEAAKKAKEEAAKKAKEEAAKKAKEEAAKKAKEEAEKAADEDDDDLLGGDDEAVYTLEQVREAMQTALGDAKASGEDVYKNMRETLSAVLKRNGAAKVSDLAEDKFVAVMDAISKAKDDLL